MNNDDLASVDAWWRAANYLSAAQIYLLGDPLLREPLSPASIKPRLLGHWGTSPALNFAWAHLNRVIIERDLEMMFVCGPGHGGPAMVASAWLDGTYSELFPEVTPDEAGLAKLVRQFSFPGGIPSHAAPETPGSVNEGGELGYSLAHAFGIALDNPDLVVACVIGDGEAETGALAASWHAHTLLNRDADGVVLPILNLNGYKIANPTVLARMPEEQLLSLLRGYGYDPVVVSGGFDDEPHDAVHTRMADALDLCLDRIAAIRTTGTGQPPMIVLRTPKGWTGPKFVDGLPVENTWRAHQVPLAEVRQNPEHLAQLSEWLESYRASELFDDDGRVSPVIARLAPRPDRRMSSSTHANGGVVGKLEHANIREFAVPVEGRGKAIASPMKTLAQMLVNIVSSNPHTFRIFGPDETASNRLSAVFDVTDRQWGLEIFETDEHQAPAGRVTELLSEHVLEGMLEGYLLSGRHGAITSYEAFIHIIDSMFNQHAKWMESAKQVSWRKPIGALVYLLSSHVWQQDHNGFSHQDPGFLNIVTNKQAELIRIFLPADANTLLAVAQYALSAEDEVEVIVVGKEPEECWLSIDEAQAHFEKGLDVWEWASTHTDREPDVVMAGAGDVPTREAIAAASLLASEFPELAIRVVNVVDLMRLQDDERNPHGLADGPFDEVFTRDRPVIFAFHGYPSLVHQLTYRRANHDNFHVHGFNEKGTTTTRFDMLLLNDLDRYQLAIDAIKRVGTLGQKGADLMVTLEERRVSARAYAYEHGEDDPEITDWTFVEAPRNA
jgi:xylulose-5-phosphate/fructose-6-phosphate phosphoketolase